jgi:hypothetical protein
MFIWFVSLILAGQPIGDLYVQTDVSPKQLQEMLKSGAPIHAYLDNCAFYVIKPGSSPPPGAQMLAEHIIASQIVILTSRKYQLSEMFTPNLPKDIRLLYSGKRFAIADASVSQRESFTALGFEYRMLRPRPLHIARPSQIPSEPQGLPIIHETISQITSEYPMLYINTMADFENRYTFDPRFQNAQMWSKDRFMINDLDTTEFFYDCNGDVNDMDYRWLDQDELLFEYNGHLQVRNPAGWNTYDTSLSNVADAKFNSDRSHLYICGSTARVGWNVNPNDYSEWEIKWTGGGSYLEGVYAEGNRIWAVGDPGLIKYSNDGGETWQNLNSGVQTYLKEIGKYHVGTGSDNWYFIVGTDGTVLRSIDGVQWEQTANLPLSGIDLYDIEGYESPNGTPHGEIVVVGSDSTIFTSADGGETWQQRYYGMTGTLHDIDYKEGRLWAIGRSGNMNLSVISDNYGLTWITRWDNHITGIFLKISIDENNRDRAYACGNNGFYAWTDDKGDTWYPLPRPPMEPPDDKNIVAELRGETKPDEIVIVCAHEDGVEGDPPDYYAPAADDNASGSAAVLAIADQMSKKRFERTVRFIHFSGEELGLLGSSAYAYEMGYENVNIIAVLNADMIGYMDNTTYDFDIGIVQSGVGAELQNFVGSCAEEYVPEITTSESESESSDHASFAEAGYQATELIEHPADLHSWNPYYHTSGDVPETLTPNLVVYGTRLYLATAMELAGYLGEREQPQPPTPPQADPYVYPNPLHVNSGQNAVTFANLNSGTKVQVFTLSGNKVWDTIADDTALSWSPNLASGIYLYTIEKDGRKFKGKLAIIK